MFLVPLLDTQSPTTATQSTSSLDSPIEHVRKMESGLVLRHLVLVSFGYYSNFNINVYHIHEYIYLHT